MAEIGGVRPSDATVNTMSGVPVGGFIKRLIDIVLAIGGIVLLLPLLTFCAVPTFFASEGEIITRHRRVGFRGRAFDCLKFEIAAPNSRNRKEPEKRPDGEPRLTPFGAVLHKAGLDALPQLFNVLWGDMSIVGPQPIAEDEIGGYYVDQVTAYLACKPGITGLWRINGQANHSERVIFDCAYAKSWSLMLDAKIAISTFAALLAPRAI